MNVKSVEKQEHSAVELVIEVPKDEFEAAVEKVYRKQRGRIFVNGFRKGKAPRSVIEGIYGTGVFYEDAINDLYPNAYSDAVEQEKLDVVSRPSVEIIEVGREGFSFKATVTVRPLGTIQNYKGLSAPKKDIELTDEDITGELKPFIDRATRMATVERPAKLGDIAVIDYEGFDNGVPFQGGKGEQHELELGSNSFIPGFEEQVVDMSAGEEKELNVTFPESYHAAELAGKSVVFKVKLHEVKERIAPEVDDEFAKDVSEFDTLEELKKDLAEKLKERREKQTEQDYEEALLNKLTELTVVEIPDSMVDYQADKMLDDYAMRLSGQGISFDQYLQIMGMTREDMVAQAKPGALRQIQGQLALEAVAEAEGIQVTDEELDQEFAKLSQEYGVELDQVKRAVSVSDLKGDLLRQKAMKIVVDNSVVDNTVQPAAESVEKTEEGTEAGEAVKTAAKPKRKSKKAVESESVE